MTTTAITGDARMAASARVGVVASATWHIDPATARAEFTIRKRLLFVRTITVTGRFTDLSGAITLDESNPATAQAEVTLRAASIETGNRRRDTHPRTAAISPRSIGRLGATDSWEI